MSGGMSGYLTAARPSGGRKRKGETPIEEFGTGSTVSCPTIRRFRELVEQCYSCTRHSNYSANRAPPPGRERLMCAAIQGGSGGGASTCSGRSEHVEGISHRYLTPLAHSCLTLARRRQHCYYTVVCVCVCMCVYVYVCVYVCVCVCVCVYVCVTGLQNV